MSATEEGDPPAGILVHMSRPPTWSAYDLVGLPVDDPHRVEIFGGSVYFRAPRTPAQRFAADELERRLRAALPEGVRVGASVLLCTPDNDGPVADLMLTGADLDQLTGPLPADEVLTVVEVVSLNGDIDRILKPEVYAEAAIPCFWRIELDPWKDYGGPLPLIVVRLREGDGWRTVEAAAGAVAELPVVVGVEADGEPVTATVTLDPAELAQPDEP